MYLQKGHGTIMVEVNPPPGVVKINSGCYGQRNVPVNCCDCQKSFLSASSLLQHFAEHVKIKVAKENYDKLKLISKSYRKHYPNKNSNENVTKIDSSGNVLSTDRLYGKNELRSVSPLVVNLNNDNSVQSEISDKSEVTSTLSSDLHGSNNDSADVDTNNDNILDVSTCGSPILEKTYSDVASSSTECSLNLCNGNVGVKDSGQFCVEFNSERMLINIKRCLNDGEVDARVIDSDKLKTAVNDENDLLKRKLSNRKQLVPKKIERSSSGLVKIAPKPKDMPPMIREYKPKQKKKYNCHLCTKSFGWSTDLKRHILVHTGERPFKCNKCQACFTRNFLLQKHKNKLHPNSTDVLEKNKLLDEKVSENLKQLKCKLGNLTSSTNSIDENELESDNNRVCVENVHEESEIEEDEEMTFAESKLDIKEEICDPLLFNNESVQNYDSHRYLYGNWGFESNNNIIDEKLIKSEENHRVALNDGTKEY